MHRRSRKGFLPALMLAVLLACSSPARAEPSWYKKKKDDQEQKAQEEETKRKELPAVGNPQDANAPKSPFSELSTARPKEPIQTNLLFKQKGFTDSFGFDFGTMKQDQVQGPLTALSYAAGWWWTPELIAGFFGRGGGFFYNGNVFLMANLGPEVRYLLNNRWAITGLLSFMHSQGLTRGASARIGVTSNDVLGARRGFVYGLQVAYMLWPKYENGMGPSLTYWGGSQSERSLSSITLGLTLQTGRPNYTGDLTK